mmetsp:Transcript_22067/g.39130  ORF Transcript_22067/g.39130 Transcript_22067/m.39130 type:complete len:292 (+) Transcript_22067:43-918(+)
MRPSLWSFRFALLAANFLSLSATTTCQWTSPDGSNFDLSGLTHDDYWMIKANDENFRYYLNVCKNAKPPQECVDGHIGNSPAFQVEAKSWKHLCKKIARLDVQSWNLLDPQDPQKGVEMVYGGGEKCGSSPREIRFHFICSPHFDEGPLQIFETKEACHYNVTWASKYGCPVGSSWFSFSSSSSSSSSSSFGFFSLLKLISIGLVVYTIVGCALLKYWNPDAPIGLGTCPNIEFWLGSLDMCIMAVSVGKEKITSLFEKKEKAQEDFDEKFPMNKDDEDEYEDDIDGDDAL